MAVQPRVCEEVPRGRIRHAEPFWVAIKVV